MKDIEVRLLAQYKREIDKVVESEDPRELKQQLGSLYEVAVNLHINPHLLLILDDCASIIDAKLQKE